LDHQTISSIKRQISFLIGGTITGAMMTYYAGFLVTVIVNSLIWYFVSLMVYRLVWRKNAFNDQMVILRYILMKLKRESSI